MTEQELDTKTPLIDEIYRKLSRATERAYARGYHKPVFQIHVSHQQYEQLELEALNSLMLTQEASIRYLFGSRIIEVDETPYVRLVEEQ
jgi:hypothetical protein